MESNAGVDMEDYWNEVRTYRSTSTSHSEEESRSHEDEGESDEHFLEELGIPLKPDSELSEDNITLEFMGTLNPRQEEALKRRVRTLNATIRRKKQRQKPDIRNFFANTDNSSTGTRSRSATPDSLDSVSPPRTPPDPHPKSWVDPYLSRSRGSLDSGNHSLVTSPSVTAPSTPFTSISDQTDLHNTRSQVGGRRHTPPTDVPSRHQWLDGQAAHLYRAPSLDTLPKVVSGPNKGKELRRQRSYARDIARDVKSFHSSKQGLYEFYPKTPQDDHDVQVLNYRYIGSVHIPHARYKDKRPSLDSNASHSAHDIDSVTDSRRSSAELRKTYSISHPRDARDYHRQSRESRENRENRPRSGSATDLGFKVRYQKADDEFPELVLETSRCGQTRMDWLDEADLHKLTSLALLELDILFTEHNIHHRWRKLKKRKQSKEESGVFGVPLDNLLERDANLLPESPLETNVPLVFYKLVRQVERHGLRQEGILRVPGHRSQTEQLRRTLDTHFYSTPSMADAALKNATPNDVAALVKTFLRELPRPLLTHAYMPAFYKTHRIEDMGERVLALTMLVLLLPCPHRDTLHAVLDLCARVVTYEADNKMSLYNVAMIMAPNLFLPNHQRSKLNLRSEDKEQQLNHEMTYASVTTTLTQAMIKYREVLWTVPHRLLAQIRRQYQAEALKQHNYTPMRRLLLSRKSKETIQRPIENEVDYQEGVLRVSAPQFNKTNYPVKLDSRMTARDLLTRFIEELTLLPENPRRVEGRRELQYKRVAIGNGSPPSTTLVPNTSEPHFLACLLTGSLKNTLQKHALHEKGGNIGDRRLDPNAKLLAIYQDNPNAEFVVKCHHQGGHMSRKNS
nr:rho GTPase-activating protein 18-like [Procambarus clarkii]XP_045595994.1 rho GTPase-activating protein 18-like [Procambarus clarkii]XP_045595995.1 rho GTPase-activating protein 18-like [Procambarus clarkii]